MKRIAENVLNNLCLKTRRQLSPKQVLVCESHIVIVVAVFVRPDQLLVEYGVQMAGLRNILDLIDEPKLEPEFLVIELCLEVKTLLFNKLDHVKPAAKNQEAEHLHKHDEDVLGCVARTVITVASRCKNY